MKRAFYFGLFFVEAIFCILLTVAPLSFSNIFTSALAFPFEQIGLILRFLSLSGGLGNIVAFLLYLILCLIPIGYFILIIKRRKLYFEDGLLVLFSLSLFVILYLMTNPYIISTFPYSGFFQKLNMALLGSCLYSILLGYFILRILRLFSKSNITMLSKYITSLLYIINVIFIYLIFGAGFSDLLNSFIALQNGNLGNEHLLGVTYIFLIFEYVISVLPYAMNIIIVIISLNLLKELQLDRYSSETISVAKKISIFCTLSLKITIVSYIGFNVAQLLFAKSLMVIRGSLEIPLFSILFVLMILLLTRLITENKMLKEDNDLFV